MNNKILFGVAAGLLIVGEVIAHVPYIEEELVRRIGPAQPAEDYSFQNPFMIEHSIEESMAVFSYLHERDVDFFKFSITPDQIGFDPITGAPTPLVNASALPPACLSYLNAYPVTALLGPGLPPPPLDVDLPFDVPPGLGVVFADNPKIKPAKNRPVFNFPEGDYAWFLPLGLTEHCLLNAPFTCDFSNTISTPIFVPGDYYLVIWNPEGGKMDYTANIGFRERLLSGPADTPEKVAARTRAAVVESVINDFKTSHRDCKRVE